MPHLTNILLLSLALLTSCGQSTGQSTKPAMTTKNEMSQYDHSNNPYYSHTDTAKLNVPLSEWKKLLPEDLYYIAFEKGTERAFTGKYWDFEHRHLCLRGLWERAVPSGQQIRQQLWLAELLPAGAERRHRLP